MDKIKTKSKFFRGLVNHYKLKQYLKQKELKFHIGCGNDWAIKKLLPDYINVDFRHTDITDLSCDSTQLKFSNNSVNAIFSNAFFEHLYKKDRIKHLKSIFAMTILKLMEVSYS